MAAKPNRRQEPHSRAVQREQPMLGTPAAARESRCWLATGRGAVAPFPLPSSPASVPHFFSVIQSQITGSQLSGSWGEGINTLSLVLGSAGKGSQRQQKTGKMSPPHLDCRHLEHRSALPLHISSLPLENMTQW